MYMHVCIGEDGSQMGNGCESHLFSNIQEWLSQNSLALYNYKVTGDNDCSHEIKRHLLFERKAMIYLDSVQFSSVAQSCPTLCDPMNRSTPGLPVHYQLPEFTRQCIKKQRYNFADQGPYSQSYGFSSSHVQM